MRQREYQFIFFLNISHSFYSEAESGKKHSHTWELEVSMHPIENDLVRFREAEQVIEKYLERFQDKYLNMIAPFHRMNPSIENFLDHVAGDIDLRMKENGWQVKSLRISENPTRTYMIDRQNMDEVRAQAETNAEAKADTEAEAKAEIKAETEAATDMTVQQNIADEKVPEEEPQIISKQLVDTQGLRVKTQIAGNMTRVVITIP